MTRNYSETDILKMRGALKILRRTEDDKVLDHHVEVRKMQDADPDSMIEEAVDRLRHDYF